LATAVFVRLTMADFRLLHYGLFGRAVHTLCEQENDCFVDANTHEDLSELSIPTWVVMGQADLSFIERTVQKTDTITAAAFLCGRYLVITPCFGSQASCAASFSRRFLSNPPPGLPSEAVLALSTHAGIESGFDSPAYAPAAPLLARLLLKRQVNSQPDHAILIDQAGMQHLHAPLVAVHGGNCSNTSFSNRFTAFYSELFQ